MNKAKKIIENLVKVLMGFIFIIFAVGFFIKGQYWESFWLTFSLIILSRLEEIKKLTLSPKKGLCVEFKIPEEKIQLDIKENKKLVNKKNFIVFKEIEEKALQHIHSKIGGSMKKQIHYVFGRPPNFQFAYTPDATIQTNKELIFIEIKYISKPEFVSEILNKTIKQLSKVIQNLGPSAGKKLVVKLVLASDFFINISEYKQLKNIELIHYQL